MIYFIKFQNPQMTQQVTPQVVRDNLIVVILHNVSKLNGCSITHMLNSHLNFLSACEIMLIDFNTRNRGKNVCYSLMRTFVQAVRTSPKFDVFKHVYPLVVDGSTNDTDRDDLKEFFRSIGMETDVDARPMILHENWHHPKATTDELIQKLSNVTKFSRDIYSKLNTTVLFIPTYFSGQNQFGLKQHGTENIKRFVEEQKKGIKMDTTFVESFKNWRAYDIDSSEFNNCMIPLNPRDGPSEFRKTFSTEPGFLVFSKPVYLEGIDFKTFVEGSGTNKDGEENVNFLKTKLKSLFELLNDPNIQKTYDWIQLVPWSTDYVSDIYGMHKLFHVPAFTYILGEKRKNELLNIKASLVKFCFEFWRVCIYPLLDSKQKEAKTSPKAINLKTISGTMGFDSTRLKEFYVFYRDFKDDKSLIVNKESETLQEETILERTEKIVKNAKDEVDAIGLINVDSKVPLSDKTDQIEEKKDVEIPKEVVIDKLYPNLGHDIQEDSEEELHPYLRVIDEKEDEDEKSDTDIQSSAQNSNDEEETEVDDVEEQTEGEEESDENEAAADKDEKADAVEEEEAESTEEETEPINDENPVGEKRDSDLENDIDSKLDTLVSNLEYKDLDRLITHLDRRIRKFKLPKEKSRVVDEITSLLGDLVLIHIHGLLRAHVMDSKSK